MRNWNAGGSDHSTRSLRWTLEISPRDCQADLLLYCLRSNDRREVWLNRQPKTVLSFVSPMRKRKQKASLTDCLMFLREHRLDTGRFKNFPSPTVRPDFNQRHIPVSSPGEFPRQRTREDGFSGLIDLWAHGQRPSMPFLSR